MLGVVGAALPLARDDLQLSALDTGLVGSASLVGLFFGGLVFGWLTDKVGRQKMYLIDLLVFLLGSLLQLVVQDAAQLLLVRFVMGAAVGADYAIAGALVAEFAPPRRRGRLLASLIVFWYVGYTLATAFGIALTSLTRLRMALDPRQQRDPVPRGAAGEVGHTGIAELAGEQGTGGGGGGDQ